MSFVTIGLTTKALIRALQWKRIEKEDNAETTLKLRKPVPKGAKR